MSQFHSDCRRTKSVSWQICLNVAYIKHFSSLSLDFSHSSKRRWEIEVFQLSRAYHANKDVFASVILVHEEIIFAILVDVLCIFKLKWLFNVICCDSPPRSSWEALRQGLERGLTLMIDAFVCVSINPPQPFVLSHLSTNAGRITCFLHLLSLKP